MICSIPKIFLDFDFEEQPGADAIRLRYLPKPERTLELAYRPGKLSGEHVAAILFRFNRKEYDHQIFSGIHHRDLVIGTRWAGSMRETGFKGVGVIFITSAVLPIPPASSVHQ